VSALTKRLPAPEVEQLQLQAKFFRGLGDPTRLKILELLLKRERTVTQLVERLGVPQGRVSSHLACLGWCGYVTATRRGRHRLYRIADSRVRQILHIARGMVADNAEHLWACTRIDRNR
jgi:DNA-binding transcriptional ArsR family regulator